MIAEIPIGSNTNTLGASDDNEERSLRTSETRAVKRYNAKALAKLRQTPSTVVILYYSRGMCQESDWSCVDSTELITLHHYNRY
jgi:hypothetical protein